MSTHDADQPGLRERKKAKTRASIREHALRLFREQGYAATRVEQIAEAAEVSPATFYRYFPTKEDVVLQDDMDVLTLEALEAQPAGLSPLAAVRGAVVSALAGFTQEERERFKQTTELTMAVPEIRARALDVFARSIDIIASVLALRAGRKADDTVVAILSLGAPRALHLRPRGGGQALRHEIGHGDLLVMGGSCQRTWEHAVPKTARAVGPRISVQFRPRGVR